MLHLFNPTAWNFVTSGGGEATFGFFRFVFAGATAGSFYVRRADSPVYRLPYAGAVGGGGAGVSTAGPVGISVSLPWAPGGGFKIYRNPLRSAELTLDDFLGTFVAFSGALTAFGSGSGTVLIFGAPAWLLASGWAGQAAGLSLVTIALASAGAGILWGSAVTNSLGVSVEMIRGEILGHQLAAAGETG